MGWDNSGRRVLAYILVFIKSGENIEFKFFQVQRTLKQKNVL
jgi:hypothetical protein